MNILHIVSIICLALCFIMFLYLKWQIKKRASFSGFEDRGEIIKLIADINHVTDRDMQLVEDRVNKLKVILQDVDNRIALYEKDLENLTHRENDRRAENNKKTALYTNLGKGIRAALEHPQDVSLSSSPELSSVPPSLPLSSSLPSQAVTTPGASSFQDLQNPLPQAALFEDIPKPLPPSSPLKPPSKKQIRSYIDLLVNEGLSPEEIASRLEISAAEVNLAMNLRRK